MASLLDVYQGAQAGAPAYTNAFGERTANPFESNEFFFADPAVQQAVYADALAKGRVDPSSGGLSLDQKIAARNRLEGVAGAKQMDMEIGALQAATKYMQAGINDPHEVRNLVLGTTGVDIAKTRIPFDAGAISRSIQGQREKGAYEMADYLSQFLPPDRVLAETARLTGVNIGATTTPKMLERQQKEAAISATRASTAKTAAETAKVGQETAAKRAEFEMEPVLQRTQVDSALQALRDINQLSFDLSEHSGKYWATGLTGTVARRIPGSPAVDFEKGLRFLKNQVGLQAMQVLKAASPQGATGLGAISAPELEMLQNSLAALDVEQSDEQLSRELRRVMQITSRMQRQLEDAYTVRYGNRGVSSRLPEQGGPQQSMVPPPAQRQPGIYATPKGNLYWTGKGWVMPGAGGGGAGPTGGW